MIYDLEIKSRKLNKTFTFSRPGKHYIYVDFNGQPGCLGYQICDGGGLTGNTISYSGDSQDVFNAVCRKWYRSYMRWVSSYM